MSAAGRGAERKESDFYETPIAVCERAMPVVPMVSPDALVLDAGAGTGHWGKVMRDLYPDVYIDGIDIRDVAKPEGNAYDGWFPNKDFLSVSRAEMGTYDVVLGNPPFSQAEQFIRHAHGLISPDGVVAFLLRLSILEGKHRGENLWKELPPTEVRVFSSRPSFTGNGHTDSSAYAMFVWRRGHTGKFTGGWI